MSPPDGGVSCILRKLKSAGHSSKRAVKGKQNKVSPAVFIHSQVGCSGEVIVPSECHSRLRSLGSELASGRFFIVLYNFFIASELITYLVGHVSYPKLEAKDGVSFLFLTYMFLSVVPSAIGMLSGALKRG